MDFAVGGGTQVLHPLGGTTRLHHQFGGAFRFDRSFALGAQVHALQNLFPEGPATRFLGDVGMQVRPTGWFALGMAAESLGAVDLADRSKLRVGASLRPLGKYLTVGADLRLVAGGVGLLAASTYTNATLEPALSRAGRPLWVRPDRGGLGATSAPLRRPTSRGGVAVEIDTERVGALLLAIPRRAAPSRPGAMLQFCTFDGVVARVRRMAAVHLGRQWNDRANR